MAPLSAENKSRIRQSDESYKRRVRLFKCSGARFRGCIGRVLASAQGRLLRPADTRSRRRKGGLHANLRAREGVKQGPIKAKSGWRWAAHETLEFCVEIGWIENRVRIRRFTALIAIAQ